MYLTREKLKEAFKDKPSILNALEDAWFPKQNCKYCSVEFRKQQNTQLFCSKSCRQKHSNRTEKGIARKKRANEARKGKRNVVKQNLKCGMCGKEYLADKRHRKNICSEKCKDDYNKYMEGVI